jgi:hypothetical protein
VSHGLCFLYIALLEAMPGRGWIEFTEARVSAKCREDSSFLKEKAF